jgi:hypothetical protein
MESVVSYQTGNYRAAILSAWIAVTYDIISKLRELAAGNDSNARRFVEDLDNAAAQHNIPQLQRIEAGLLEQALRDFEFLSLHEHTDLARLRDDRHLCAHPTLTRDDTLFQPTPELVRTHIVHAITHLLQHQPVQGKSALDRIVSDLKSTAFPSDQESVAAYLNNKYFDRAKPALVRNAVIVLLKLLLRGGDADLIGKEDRIIHSLITIKRRHIQLYEELMPQKMPQLITDLPDDRLGSFFALLSVDNRCWDWIGEAERIKIRELVKEYSERTAAPDSLGVVRLDIRGAMVVDELRSAVLGYVDGLDAEKKLVLIGRYPHPAFASVAIGLYANAGNFRYAESVGRRVILPMAEYFTADDVIKVLWWVKNNNQIWAAIGTQEVLMAFFDKTLRHLNATGDAWRDLLAFGFEDGGNRAEYFQALADKLSAHGISHP